MAVSCPRGRQERARAVVYASNKVCSLPFRGSSVNDKLEGQQAYFRYTGIHFPPVSKHAYGSIDVWPKNSDLIRKVRP
eukprot:6298591-Pyramimonas_sp.AAC.1